MRVSEIRIYPIKSLRGISVQSDLVETRGLRDDRRMMLVDESGRMLTQREHAKMALIDVARVEGGWVVGPDRTLVADDQAEELVHVTVWQSSVLAQRISNVVDAAMSDIFGFPTRLVRMVLESQREVTAQGGRPGDELSFADAFPVLVAGEASLEDLNSRLQDPLEMRRFRPNVIVAGSAAFQEDEWTEIAVGEVKFRGAKRCGRCVVTTLDPETGVGGVEPLKTLATYRHNGKSVDFGMYFIPTTTGTVYCGNTVNVSSRTVRP